MDTADVLVVKAIAGIQAEVIGLRLFAASLDGKEKNICLTIADSLEQIARQLDRDVS
jgi:hypothetical protein